MVIESLFATRLYRKVLPRAGALNAELEKTCLAIAREDRAGRRWSKDHGYTGYTSYASLNDLPLRAPVFAELRKHLDAHVKAFAKALQFERARLSLDSMWINAMEKGGVHTAHIHPHSVISGTYYVTIPEGASAIKFEDPRLPMMMAAPAKKPNAARANRPFVTVEPAPGTILLWESWLRHEVVQNTARGKRISVSFNYA
ncbi:MAG TPA: TIGR02466 family protein [Rhizomicrobium sp.]|nr:TIGR02466 family protein [Rhizomicrobium sp.]